MAGGVGDGIWAIVGDTQWGWCFGKPTQIEPGLVVIEMLRRENFDEYECWTGTHRLVLTGQELHQDTGNIASRIRPLPTGDGDKPFVGFDNLPEPEFGTGWDDFDWSK